MDGRKRGELHIGRVLSETLGRKPVCVSRHLPQRYSDIARRVAVRCEAGSHTGLVMGTVYGALGLRVV